ncbi:RnfH family protein [Psychrobacter sp. 1U2]|uniref:RnfH family protein n=1 Tax=Psychrobacter sp. 1U2 TaxID=3453577 RepID=UPI003F45E59E
MDTVVVKLMDKIEAKQATASTKASMQTMITVYLAYAETAQRQHYKSLAVKIGTTLYEALAQAGWLSQFEGLAVWCEQMADVEVPKAKLWHVGVYAQKQPLSYQLQASDRIEVYRSLNADPMSQRKSKSVAKPSS